MFALVVLCECAFPDRGLASYAFALASYHAGLWDATFLSTCRRSGHSARAGRTFDSLRSAEQAEMWTRLLGSACTLVMIGRCSEWSGRWRCFFVCITAWLRSALGQEEVCQRMFAYSTQESKRRLYAILAQVVLGLIGQMIINNSDILIVKSFFPASSAGQYAALALIGRMVFFATWSVVMVMFPYVTQRQQRGEAHRSLLWLSLGIGVMLVSCCIVFVSFMMPEFIVNIFFGKQYLSIAGLLGLYALATAFYALANVIVTYHLSLGNGKGNYIVLAAGIAQVVGLLAWHTTLASVVLVRSGESWAVYCLCF